MAIKEIKEYIDKIKDLKVYRTQNQKNKQYKISFSSNDYLGLSKNQEILDSMRQAKRTSACSSKYLSGYSQTHQDIEKLISQINQTESSLIFSSGYLANLGTISSMMKLCNLVILDKQSHASIIDGVAMGCSPYQPMATITSSKSPSKSNKAQGNTYKVTRYLHNDTNHLESILKEQRTNSKHCLIITESIFSISGTISNIPKMLQLASKYDCFLLIDTAHSLGILNPTTPPTDEYSKLIITGNFSKATALAGGYTSTTAELNEYLSNTARTQIYNSALPDSTLLGIKKALEILERNAPDLTPILKANNFINKLNSTISPQNTQTNIQTNSHIVFIAFDDISKATDCYSDLEENEIQVSLIRPPTFQVSGLRISFTSSHTQEDIDKLSSVISKHKHHIITQNGAQ